MSSCPTCSSPSCKPTSSLDRNKGVLVSASPWQGGWSSFTAAPSTPRAAAWKRALLFTVTLPLVDAPASRIAGTPGASAALRARRVLVVEDNRDAAETLRDLLELDGHRVELACDGRAAVAKARSFAPDVVICDIGLPEMNGFEVARALRAEPGLSQPILVAAERLRPTGRTSPGEGEAGLRRAPSSSRPRASRR